jgi:alpha-beta hydrolase superfamily lysophospholipase
VLACWGSRSFAPCFVSVAAILVSVVARGEFARAQAEPRTPAVESRGLLPLSSFYSTPAPLPAGRPGQLIRSERVDEYQLPEGISAVRILYHSRSANGGDVVASGVVLMPDEPPPVSGRPVIAWAHGFTGLARHCAPSLMRNLNQGPVLSMYVKLGYAVVAADYAGLGTDFRNASVDIQTNATDVLYSIAAAHSAVPGLGNRWIVIGESTGGLAALGVAELEGEIRDPGYLGAIAVSTVADAKDADDLASGGSFPGRLFALVYGVQTLYPAFDVNQVLTDKSQSLYRRMEHACAVTVPDFELSAGAMLKQDWKENGYVQQFLARNTIGRKPAQGPVLIVSSDSDPVVRTGIMMRMVARMCKRRDVVLFHQYRNSDSASLLGDSVRDQLTWIQARFAGRPASSNCH